ncbi:MAG: mannose-1-phosphate guanylyltransferase/mannose-6-phosphate isomerase [Cohaesibacter sp.]|jgi:mannose-1-phosphate guanylyltransferase/mannose-6-phosphate isomerase|nr:mannose-1-phosphate guanylyltransferase/mannose-6-phosphate isomerase [Cohaesibacter sp.]
MTETSIIHPVILCGGSGTRLWPLSRKSYPKQFSALLGEESLFQKSVGRLTGEGFARPVIVTGDPFRFIVTEQLAAIEQDPAAILIEPQSKNTAPAVLAAALYLSEKDPDALMLVAPSDHVFRNEEAFRKTVKAAVPAALSGDLVTFGIQPTKPETGYGYLELTGAIAAGKEGAEIPSEPQPLRRFVEKPDFETAKAMLAAGSFLWNAGIFLFSVKAILKAFGLHAPGLVPQCEASIKEAHMDLAFLRLAPDPWAELEDISIDYAVMEKADNLSVMPFFAGWSDLGSWEAVWQESKPDEEGNVVSDHAQAIDCKDSLLRSESEGQELVGIGLDNLVAIAMPDAVVVAPKSQSQRIKEAVSALKAKQARQATDFPRDHRPWGWFESLAISERFQVKRIVVHPGAALSLQSHHHRAEHWIVVAGTARITIGEEVKLVTENESVYIPLGTIHRLENPGKVPMVLIEVQTGAYLGEDDIIRYDDVYHR